ncbi:MAG: endonuclease/exonuclease/phosphatase family protein [Cyclobacteriaceae bacterium]
MIRLRLSLVIVAAMSSFSGWGQGESLSICTFNIRWDNKADSANQWDNRKEDIVNFINYYTPDAIGLQEALVHQVQYLDSALLDYGWVGVGRDDGKEAGEFCPVLYNKIKYTLDNSGTFWLSEEPEKPGIGWDAACSRICTYAVLKNKESGIQYSVFNTHFDHVGKEARKRSADLIIDQMQSISKHSSNLLIGDFNLETTEPPIQKILNSGFLDAYQIAESKFGSMGTFNGFDYVKIPSRRIDYVFVDESIQVRKYRVISDVIEGRYLSDHFPVLVKLTLEE